VAVAIVALAVIAPALFTGYSLGQEAGGAVGKLRAAAESGALQQSLQSQPRLAPVVSWANQQGDLGGQLQGLASEVTKHLGSLLGGSVMAIVQLLLTLFLLFYFFRDRSKVLATVRSLLPLSGAEADRLFSRVYETVHATIYGTVLVALVQGALGGLMFWWLGLPAPLLWGVVMALLAIVPVFGAFIIWIPAAIFLAMSGQWGKAMILTGWGAVVIGLVDNLLYPMFVGSKLRMHTVPVFIAIVGGLALFGGSGLVLGPVTLAVTIALVEVWRRRTAAGGTAEEGVHAPALARESALSAEPPKEHATQ
jgi:predicted PurR-regulated permease PerM